MVLTLRDGTLAGTEDITFDPSSYHFYWDSGAAGKIDITDQLTRAQKQDNWPKFDPRVDNDRVSVQTWVMRYGKAPLPTGSSSTMQAFWNQMVNNPFQAPISLAEQWVSGAGKEIAKSTGLQTLLILGLVGYGLVLFGPQLLAASRR